LWRADVPTMRGSDGAAGGWAVLGRCGWALLHMQVESSGCWGCFILVTSVEMCMNFSSAHLILFVRIPVLVFASSASVHEQSCSRTKFFLASHRHL